MSDKRFLFLLLPFLAAGCGGNVDVTTGGNGAGGNGGDGGNGGATITSTGTTGTVTTTNTFATCTGPGQCVLVPTGCCWGCGFPSPADFAAVHSSQVNAYSEWVCPEGGECPLCESQPNPNIFAYCDAGTCQVGFVPEHPVSECAGDGDCTLRATTECCEPCGQVPSYLLTAVSVTADPSLNELVCAPDQPCDACVPSYPAETFAVCSGGHCAVAILD